MRLVTFNVHHGTVGDKGPVDARRLGEVCASFDADVLALQEVDDRTFRSGRVDIAAEVADRCGMEHVFGASRWFPGGHYGNALFVRGDIRSWAVLGLPKVPAWKRWQEPRTAIVAEVTVDGVDLTAVCTHLAVPHPVNGPQLDHLLATVADRHGHVAVLGDLNRFPATVEPAAVAAGLQYVRHAATNPVVPRPRKCIDHVLLSHSLRRVRARVRTTEMSDHAALLVDVEPLGDLPGAADRLRAIVETGR